jgi:3-oxoacyl-[acyl-carrier protein] reductase
MFELKDRVALVTGGSRGIGRAIAQTLGAQGASVVVGFGRGEAEAAEVVQGIVASGGRAEAVGFDVADWLRAEQVVDEIGKRHGRLDILVANAGITIDALLPRIREADFDRVWSTSRGRWRARVRPSSR